MGQDTEHLQKVIAARDREVTHRRGIGEALAEKHDRSDTENMREAFIKIQDVIEAIERAIWHEIYRRPKVRAVLAFRLQRLIQRINRQRTNRQAAGAIKIRPPAKPQRAPVQAARQWVGRTQ